MTRPDSEEVRGDDDDDPLEAFLTLGLDLTVRFDDDEAKVLAALLLDDDDDDDDDEDAIAAAVIYTAGASFGRGVDLTRCS